MGLLFYQVYAIFKVMETNITTDTQTEKQPELGRIEVRVGNYTAAAKSEPDPLKRLELTRGLLDDIEQEVEAGHIKQSNNGEPYDAPTIEQQLFAFADQMNTAPQNRMEKPALLIPGAEGFRKSMMALMSDGMLAAPVLTAIGERKRTRERIQLFQESIARKMGDNALSIVDEETKDRL